jgi:hypothetical protein
MDGFLGSTPLRPGQSEYPNMCWQNANLALSPCQCRFETYRQLFVLSEHGGLEDLLWWFTPRSILTGHTTESKSVEPADDAVFTPLWFTYGQFLECWFPMVLAKWLAESKSVSLGLRRFETYRWQVFCLPEHTLTFTYGWFPRRLMQLVLAMCLPQQSWHLIPID